MYKDKGSITEDEQNLISRYPVEVQENLKKILIRNKTWHESSYNEFIEAMEKGREINYSVTEKGVEVLEIGKPNISRLVRAAIEMEMGSSIKPTESELKHDDRMEEFKQHTKGTRVKSNGEVVFSE